jgi:hypothetical protein
LNDLGDRRPTSVVKIGTDLLGRIPECPAQEAAFLGNVVQLDHPF